MIHATSVSRGVPCPVVGTTGLVWLVVLYCAVHFVVRLLLSPTLGWDDAESTLWAQSFRLGYSPLQPPLYVWLLGALYAIFGHAVWVTALLRYALVLGTYLLLIRISARLTPDPYGRMLALASYALIYTLAYYQHHDLTNTTAMLFAVALSFNALLTICSTSADGAPPKSDSRATGSMGPYALLGLALAVGCLSKYNFANFLVAMGVAWASMPSLRGLLWCRATLWTLIVFAALIGPHVFWRLTAAAPWSASADELLELSAHGAWLARLPAAVLKTALAPLILLTPMIVIAPLCFSLRGGLATPHDTPTRKLLGRMILIATGLTALILLISATGSVKPRWFLPGLALLPIYLFSAPRTWGSLPGTRWYLVCAAVVTIAALAGRPLNDYLEPRRDSHRARRTLPVDLLARQIATRFPAGMPLIVETNHLAGNLAFLFPDRQVDSLEYRPPAVRSDRPLLFLWKISPDHEPPRVLHAICRQEGQCLSVIPRDGVWKVPFPGYPARIATFGYHVSRPRDER